MHKKQLWVAPPMLPLIVLRLRSASKAIVRDAGLGVSRVRGRELLLESHWFILHRWIIH